MQHIGASALTQPIGYAASTLVLATFSFSNLVWLRVFALQSNIAFGYLSAVYPVMLLHMVLLPINVFHLAKLLLKSSRVRPAAARLTALPRPDRPA
jgi:CRP/FNR family transcriptional regulator, cyclic AMP receptor protein